MAESSGEAALPWARPAPENTPAPPQEPLHDPQLAEGARVEVRWQVTDEETGESSTKWWGAAVAQRREEENASVWTLRYDASDGFEEEEASVRFLCERYLKSLEDGSVLRWKLEGAEVDDEDEDELGEETVVLGELTAAYEEAEREMGQTMEEVALKELRTLEPCQQQKLISGFTDYLNSVKTQLRQIVDGKDENYVVTENDVKQIVQSVKRQKSG